MSSKVVVVQEAPPTLESLSSVKIREFLRAYKQYYERYKRTKSSPTMMQLINTTNLSVLRSLKEMEQMNGMIGIDEILSKEDSESEEESSSDEDDDDNESVEKNKGSGRPKAKQSVQRTEMSDEEIEEILVKHYGPVDEEAAIKLLRGLNMERVKTPFEQLVPASKYIEEWKEMLTWCKLRNIRSKILIQTFLNGISPKGLGTMIAHKGYKKLKKVMEVFIVLYQQSCQAYSLMVSVGMSCETKPSSSNSGNSSSSSSSSSSSNSSSNSSSSGNKGNSSELVDRRARENQETNEGGRRGSSGVPLLRLGACARRPSNPKPAKQQWNGP